MELQPDRDSLNPQQRSTDAFAFAQNYEEAAVIEFFQSHVPEASGHNQYWLWGTHGHSGNVIIDVDGGCGVMQDVFRSAVRAATFSSPYVLPLEDNIPIMVFRSACAARPSVAFRDALRVMKGG